MGDGKARNGRRAALGLALAAMLWLVALWPPPIWWRDHWPHHTAMMRWAERRDTATAVAHDAHRAAPYRPITLPAIPSALQRMVILAEDSRFRTHAGVDPQEIKDAARVPPGTSLWRTASALWRRRDRVRGASTITQQLAKNLYLSPSRSAVRKLKEATTALHLELALSKDRILELYLNIVEWGPGVWGVDQASRVYFDVPPGRLDEWQAASLAATLPNPRTSNPAYQPARMALRRDLILARYHGADVAIPRIDDLFDGLPEIRIDPPPVLVPPALESLRAAIREDSGPKIR